MLLQPIHHNNPFPFFLWMLPSLKNSARRLSSYFCKTVSGSIGMVRFTAVRCATLLRRFPQRFMTEILARMREITGLPLVERFMVTAQRMLPGQVIGIHSDRPLLGYEIARLVRATQ